MNGKYLKQIKKFVKAQQKSVFEAETLEDRANAIGFYAGFLNAMRMFGVISKSEYNKLYEDMKEFCDITSA